LVEHAKAVEINIQAAVPLRASRPQIRLPSLAQRRPGEQAMRHVEYAIRLSNSIPGTQGKSPSDRLKSN
jgi:hypothetical protein